MKRFYVLVTLGLFSLAAAQKLIVYRDNLKNPHVIIQWTQGFLAPGENFELNGNVQFKRIETDGKAETVMSCSKASGNLVKLKNKTEFDKVRMTGGVRLTQTSKTSSIGGSGDSADYDLKDGIREVNIRGDVKIDFSGESSKTAISKTGQKTTSKVNSTMKTTSRSATLAFKTKVDEKKAEYSELQSATIHGPIRFDGVQVVNDSNGEKTQKVWANADQMTFNRVSDNESEVRLEGNLEFHEAEGNEDGAVVEGANLLVMILNKNNEIVKLKFSSGGVGQVKTTVTKNDKKGGGA